jgi:protocatechuate 3,4-dioxygenase beta subunit
VTAQDQSASAGIDGTIVREGTDEPIQGAKVTLMPLSGAATVATSGEDGKFSISGLKPGTYQLNATQTGFVKARRNGGPSNLTLIAGQRERGVRIQLAATGMITGRVLDENGRPLTTAHVFAVRPEYQHGRRVIPVCHSGSTRHAQTNSNGEYRILDLEPNDYFVFADREGVRCGTFFYPGVTDLADAVLQAVRSGGEASGITFQLLPMSRFSAHFKIISPPSSSSQTPMVQTQLIRLSRNGIAVVESIMSLSPLGGGAETLTNGDYTRSGLLPGSYELFLGYNSGAQIGHASFEITDRDFEGGTIVVQPSIALSGRVYAPDGAPAEWSVNKTRVVLSPMDFRDRTMALAVAPQTGVATDGSFLIAFTPNPGTTERLGRVAEGLYQISLNGLLEDQYLASAQYGTVNVMDGGLKIDGPAPGPLTLAVKNGGRVDGIVQNVRYEAVADCRVVIVPSQNHRGNPSLFKTAFSDQNGNFSLRGVAPGDYSVFAWEDVENGAWENEEYLKDFENRAMHVTVLPGTASNVSVRLIPTP